MSLYDTPADPMPAVAPVEPVAPVAVTEAQPAPVPVEPVAVEPPVAPVAPDPEPIMAPAVADPAPVMDAPASTSPKGVGAMLDDWVINQIHNSPIARDVEAFNHLTQVAIHDLKARIIALF